MTAHRKPANDAATDFARRPIGPSPRHISVMLESFGARGLEAWRAETLPASIRQQQPLALGAALSEPEALSHMRKRAAQNTVFTSMIGQGYSGTLLPTVIQRNILENPAWYTAYTPYQPEISQGRLEALLNYQTMIPDLTALDIANASMLDEATAVAEAVTLMRRSVRGMPDGRVVLDAECLPQTVEVVRTRCEALGIDVQVADLDAGLPDGSVFGVVVQYPGS